jgi:hypothetical protein
MFHVKQSAYPFVLHVQRKSQNPRSFNPSVSAPSRTAFFFYGRFSSINIAKETANFFGYHTYTITNTITGQAFRAGKPKQADLFGQN